MVGDAQCIFLGVGFLKLGIGGNQLSNIGLVGRSRVDVELGGIGSVVALESYFLISAAYVKGFLILHGVFLTVYSNHSVTAGIDDTQFAAFEEVSDFRTQFTEHFQLQCLVHRHGATVNQSVVEGVGYVDFIRSHHFVHHESAAQKFRVIMLHVLRMAGGLHFVIHLGIGCHGNCSHHKCKY